MRYPPATFYQPRRSWVYGATAVVITSILIALCAASMPARGHFGFKNALLIGLCAVASLWLLRDAWQVPRGQLHYAPGQWVWQRGDADIAGTLRLHLDLQRYMLVSFVPQQSSHRFPFRTTQWFHLEARHVDQAAGSFAWGGLRRAVIARTEPSHEAVAT